LRKWFRRPQTHPHHQPKPPDADAWVENFSRTSRRIAVRPSIPKENYAQALAEFFRWHLSQHRRPPSWSALQRDDFPQLPPLSGPRRIWARHHPASFQRLRSFTSFSSATAKSPRRPIKNLSFPSSPATAKFLSGKQMEDCWPPLWHLDPLKNTGQKKAGRPNCPPAFATGMSPSSKPSIPAACASASCAP